MAKMYGSSHRSHDAARRNARGAPKSLPGHFSPLTSGFGQDKGDATGYRGRNIEPTPDWKDELRQHKGTQQSQRGQHGTRPAVSLPKLSFLEGDDPAE